MAFYNCLFFYFRKYQSLHSESTDKSSTPSEELQENKPSKHKHNASTRSNSSSQSSGSSKETELISSSSSPFIKKSFENLPNSASENNVSARDIDSSYKESEKENSEFDPILAALNDLKDMKVYEDHELINEEVKPRSSKHDITFNGTESPEQSKCLLLDALKSYVNSAVSKSSQISYFLILLFKIIWKFPTKTF